MICPEKDGTPFCRIANNYLLCNNVCQPSSEPCNGVCDKRFPFKCGQECKPESAKAIYYECDGKCMYAYYPCKGVCPKDYPLQCPKICLTEDSYEWWGCNGKCISTSVPCQGNCSSFKPKLCGN